MNWRQFLFGYRKNGYLIKYDFKMIKNPKLLLECAEKLSHSQHKHKWLVEMCIQYQKIPEYISAYPSILGPISLHYLTSKMYPHRILILGDVHTKKRKCNTPGIPVDEFIHTLIQNTHHFIDLFLEIPYYYYKKYNKNYYDDLYFKDSYLTQTMKSFLQCSLRLKQKCNLDRCRTHFSDIRSYLLKEEKKYIFSDDIYNIVQNINKLREYLYNDVNIRHQLVMKQINYIPNKKLQTQLKRGLEECINSDFEILCDNIHHDPENPDIKRDLKSRGLKPYMDLYLLARILRKFKSKGESYNQGCYNSIVYVGDQHAQFYISLLTKIGWKVDYNRKVDHNQCLVLDSIKKRFFD